MQLSLLSFEKFLFFFDFFLILCLADLDWFSCMNCFNHQCHLPKIWMNGCICTLRYIIISLLLATQDPQIFSRTGLLMEFVCILKWPYFEDKSNWLGEASNLICKAEFSKFCKAVCKILWIKFVYKLSSNFSTEQNCVERIKLIIMKWDWRNNKLWQVRCPSSHLLPLARLAIGILPLRF